MGVLAEVCLFDTGDGFRASDIARYSGREFDLTARCKTVLFAGHGSKHRLDTAFFFTDSSLAFSRGNTSSTPFVVGYIECSMLQSSAMIWHWSWTKCGRLYTSQLGEKARALSYQTLWEGVESTGREYG